MGKLIPKRLSPSSLSTVPQPQYRLPELLAPAGDWDCVKAAVAGGADAVYFGLERFNARLRAQNFTTQDLPALMAYLHERGLKGYVTFNTLVFPREIKDAEAFLKSIIQSGVDAAIVQDVGICRRIRALSPDFPIHASTQMTITSDAGVAFATELGCSVVVLARECSLEEIRSIRSTLEKQQSPVPLEIFVHGALCVAYSGQCLTSESLGGRSANRGECAQACRLPYELIANGMPVPLGDKRYLLSPQDLAGITLLPDIIRSGVATLKIEGRLKSPEYVAAVTSVYRKALDEVWSSLDEGLAQDFKPAPEDHYRLEMTFSRGLSTGWLNGIDNQVLVHARFGKKRGLLLGTVREVAPQGVLIEGQAPLAVGDGVVFDAGRPDLDEQGGRVFRLEKTATGYWIGFQRGHLDPSRIQKGQNVWKTSDPALEKDLRKIWESPREAFPEALHFCVKAASGFPLVISARDDDGHSVEVTSEAVLSTAHQHPTDREKVQVQLSRLGDTPFRLASLEWESDGKALVPLSMLNQMRRAVVHRMLEKRKASVCWTLNESELANAPLVWPEHIRPEPEAPRLIPLVRTPDQLNAVLEGNYAEIYIELEDPSKYATLVAQIRARGPATKVWIAPPRIFKMGEDWIIKQLEKSGADGLLARNHEHLRAWHGRSTRGDFSLNVCNAPSAQWYAERWEISRLTVSYDLDAEQVVDLLQSVPRGLFEVTIHQHMPMFHMEHCVFCAFLSKGKDFRDCGRPCETQTVKLRDRVGAEHTLKADGGCRNTVFNSRAQTGAEFAHLFLESGAAALRIEFLDESAQETLHTLQSYEKLLSRELGGKDLWRELKLVNQLGVTRGTLKR